MTNKILRTNLLVKVFVTLFSFITFSTEAQKLIRKKISQRDFIMNAEVVKKIGGTKNTDYIKYLIAKRKEAVKRGINNFPIFLGDRVINSSQLPSIKSKEDFISFLKNNKPSSLYSKGNSPNVPSSNLAIGFCNNNDLNLHTTSDEWLNYASNIALNYSDQNALVTASSNFYFFLLNDNYPIPGYHSTTDGANSWSGKYEIGQYNTTVYPAYDDLADEFGMSYLDYNPFYPYGLKFLKSSDVGAHWYKQTLIYDDWYVDDHFIELPYTNDQLLYNNYPSSTLYGELWSGWTTTLWTYDPNDPFQILYLSRLFFSTDDGDTFIGPGTLTDHYSHGTSLTYKDDGEIYACWLDLGEFGTWDNLKVGFTTIHENGSIDAPTLIQSVNMPGNFIGNTTFKIAVDNSQGIHRGRIYILFNEYELIFGQNIFRSKVIYSDNGGATWSSPTIITNPYYSTMARSISVDNQSGVCYIGFSEYEAQDMKTKIAFSENGGSTFEVRTISDLPPSSTYLNYWGCELIPQNNSIWASWTAQYDNVANPPNSLSKLYFDRIQIQRLEVTQNPGCAPGTATVMGLQPNSTVTWSSFPTGIINITTSGNGQTANYSVISPGNVTIYATISGPCPQVLDKTIIISPANIPVTGVYTSAPAYINQTLNAANPLSTWKVVTADVQNSFDPNATYQWQLITSSGGTPTFTTNTSGSNITITRNNAFYFQFSVRVITYCGEVLKYYSFGLIDPITKSEFEFNYNTVIRVLKINSTDHSKLRVDDKPNSDNSNLINDIRYVRIYDNVKRLISEKRYPPNTKQIELNLYGLKAGMYFVEAGNQENHISRPIYVF